MGIAASCAQGRAPAPARLCPRAPAERSGISARANATVARQRPSSAGRDVPSTGGSRDGGGNSNNGGGGGDRSGGGSDGSGGSNVETHWMVRQIEQFPDISKAVIVLNFAAIITGGIYIVISKVNDLGALQKEVKGMRTDINNEVKGLQKEMKGLRKAMKGLRKDVYNKMDRVAKGLQNDLNNKMDRVAGLLVLQTLAVSLLFMLSQRRR